jgi:hypothetical protein
MWTACSRMRKRDDLCSNWEGSGALYHAYLDVKGFFGQFLVSQMDCSRDVCRLNSVSARTGMYFSNPIITRKYYRIPVCQMQLLSLVFVESA